MAWLSGWSYRKEISITGQSGAGTNYQVDLDIGDSAGGDFHLEGHCTNFPQDIEVTDNDGTPLLDFWIEDITADPIKMWVEVADDLGSNQTIYIYYSKSGATTNRDIENTFLFGDDFPGSSIDTGKWDGPTERASVSTGIMTFAGANDWGKLKSISQFGPDVAIKTKIKMFTGLSHIVQWGLNNPSNLHYSHADIRYDPANYIYSKDGTTASNVNSNWPIDTWFIGELNVIGGTNVAAYIDGVEATGSPKTTNPSNSSELEITFLGRITDSTTAIQSEWILIRKYLATEPAFSSAGSEETDGATEVYLTLSQNLSTSGLGQANAQGPVILSNTLATIDGGGANASAPITVDDLLGLIGVGQAQTDQNIVLTNSLLFTTGADAVAQSTLDISEILSILQAGTATSSAGVTLNEILTILQTTANEFDVDISLSEILSILQAGLSDSEGNLALSELLNISNSATAISSGSLSLSEILTILESTTGLFYKDVSLSETLSVLQNGLVSSGGSLSIPNILSILSASQSTAGASAVFTKNLSLSQTTAEITQSYLTLAYDLALNTQSVSTAASTLALAINSGISATVMVNFEGALPLSQSSELSSVGRATLQSELSFNNILSISILAEALASAGISLNMVESVITNGTLVSITVTTPEGRTVIIGVEIRTEIILGENRIVIVPEKNRMTII